MKFYIGFTDDYWFHFLAQQQLEEVNFRLVAKLRLNNAVPEALASREKILRLSW